MVELHAGCLVKCSPTVEQEKAGIACQVLNPLDGEQSTSRILSAAPIMPPSKTCLYLINNPGSSKLGGGGLSMLTLWKALPGSGWTAHAVLPGNSPVIPPMRAMGVANTVYYYQQPGISNPVLTLRNYNAWNRIIERVKPDIIHANSPDVARSVMPSAARCGVKVICHVHFPLTNGGIPWAFRHLPKPAAFIFNSKFIRDEIWPELSQRCKTSKEYLVYNGIDLSVLQSHPWPGDDPYRVGMIANLRPFKRHEYFIKVASLLLQRGLNIEFLIVGSDYKGRARELQNMAAILNIEDKIHFLGHQTDIPGLIRKMNVSVLTSKNEPFGRVLIESLACGRPLVAFHAGGAIEAVIDGETGFLVEEGDIEAMADRVALLLEDRQLWQKMSRAGVSDVNARFSAEKICNDTLEVYRAVLGS